MKTCTMCKIEKPLDEFHVKRRNKDGRQSRCKLCQNSLIKQHYKENVDYYIQKAAVRTKREKDVVFEFLVEYFREHPCVDCGITDIRVLEFDHVRGVKSFNIGHGLSQMYSIERIQAEIEKCDVRCANCHKIVTHERANTRRARHHASLHSPADTTQASDA